MDGLYKSRVAAVYLQDVADVSLDDVSVEWARDLPPTFGSALDARHVDGLALRGFDGVAAEAGMPARRVEDTRLVGSVAGGVMKLLFATSRSWSTARHR